jgi:hypothetical protein
MISTFALMSTYGIPITARISEDFLFSSLELSKIKQELSKNKDFDNSSINEKLFNIVTIFNENVSYINKTVLEARTAQYDTAPEDREVNHAKQKLNIYQLRTLGCASDALAEQIFTVITKLKKRGGTLDKELPWFVLKEAQVGECSLYFQPGLRLSETARTKIQEARSIRQREAFEKEEPRLKALAREQFAAQHIEVTLTCAELTSGNVLGICCDPNWAEAPIAFTKTEKGWNGHIPKDKDWKCVIIQEGRIVKWENLTGNHRCGAETQPFTLNVTF